MCHILTQGFFCFFDWLYYSTHLCISCRNFAFLQFFPASLLTLSLLLFDHIFNRPSFPSSWCQTSSYYTNKWWNKTTRPSKTLFSLLACFLYHTHISLNTFTLLPGFTAFQLLPYHAGHINRSAECLVYYFTSSYYAFLYKLELGIQLST